MFFFREKLSVILTEKRRVFVLKDMLIGTKVDSQALMKMTFAVGENIFRTEVAIC